MPHKRSRPDWPITTYKYSAEPVGDLPDGLWRAAKSMQWLWAQLVLRREAVIEELSESYAEAGRIKKELPASNGEGGALRARLSDLKEEQRGRWQRHEEETRDFLRSAEVKERLNWQCVEAVVTRYQTASRKAFKDGGRLRAWRRLDHVAIPIRFTGGGMELDNLFSRRARAFNLKPVREGAYDAGTWEHKMARVTTGRFKIGEEFINFRANLHRPIAPDSVVKSVAWCGVRHPVHDWVWHLNVTAEAPPAPAERTATGLACAIDLGWRKLGEDALRVGMIRDTAGRTVELRLPLTGTGTSRTKWAGMPETIYDVWALDEQIGGAVQSCKDELAKLKLPDLPQEIKASLAALGKMRQGGLRRLLRALSEHNESAGDQQIAAAITLLAAWDEEDKRLYGRRVLTVDRLVRRKKWIYQNLAVWVARNYDAVVWEGNLALKQMAEHPYGEDGQRDPALVAAGKFRQWAGVGELRAALARAWEKHGVTRVDAQAGYSTVTCRSCGEQCEPTPRRVIKCPNGHRIDQDVQACDNLLRQLPEGGAGFATSAPGIEVPDILRKVVVPFYEPEAAAAG